MTTRQETLVAVAVQGDRNFARITSPAELNDATLDKLAQVVARKAPGRVYQLVRILNRTWHVGEGFEHSEGWWVRAGEGE